MVKNQGTKQREQRTPGDCWQWESNWQCSKGDNCSFLHDINKRAKSTQPNPSPSPSTRQNEGNASRTKSPKELAPIHSVKSGILQYACSTSPRVDADFGEKCSYAHRQVYEQPCKRYKKNGDKGAFSGYVEKE